MVLCWAPSCKHYNVREKCKFFVFPKNEKEKQRWLKLLRRTDAPGPGARVCSCHFRDGKRENGPEIFEHNKEKMFGAHHLTPEKKFKKKARLPSTVEESEAVPSTSRDQPSPSMIWEESCTDYTQAGPSSQQQQIEGSEAGTSVDDTSPPFPQLPAALEAENYFLRKNIEEKEALLQKLQLKFSYEHIRQKDRLVLLYTGIPTAQIFESLCSFIRQFEIKYYLTWRVTNLSRVDQILITLMKLRHNFPHQDLAVRFGISATTVTNIVVTHIHVLYEVLYKRLMAKIPSRQKNKSCLPNCFSTFTNCRIIIDCTEITSAVPRKSMTTQRATYSSYKHRNTWKGLVGVAPNGVVTYVSSLYPGSTSDKKIVEVCGITEQLVAGDLVIADKGFLIRDILPPEVDLNIPPFLSMPQLSPEQISWTQRIARARVHVERAIGRMKVYKILDFIPTQLFPYGSTIFKVVASLTNLQYPLIKEVEQLYCLDENYEDSDVSASED